MDKTNWSNIAPSQVTAPYNERDRLRAENERLTALIGRLLSRAHGRKPYARGMLVIDNWECAYCGQTWDYDGPEDHAADCPVLEGRAGMAEEG